MTSRFNPKILTISLVSGLLFLSAGCSKAPTQDEINLANIKESCLSMARHQGVAQNPDSLCPCFESEIKNNFSKNEQIIIANVMADGAERMANGHKDLKEETFIIKHSNFNASESKRFSIRVSKVMSSCANESR